MKVLLFIPELDHGGPDRVFSVLAASLPAHGIETSVLVQVAGGHYWECLPASIEKTVLSLGDAEAPDKRYPVRAFADAVRQLKPDVVLCTLRSHFTATAAAAMGKLRVPLVIRPANRLTRNSLELFRQSPIKHGLSWLAGIISLHAADHIICQSEDLQRDFRRYGVRDSKLSVIGNPIDLTEPEEVVHQPLPGSPALVAVGRLMPQKGFDILIDAFALLRDRLPDAQVTIFGEGPDRVALEQKIQQLGLAERVHLPGFAKNVSQSVSTADFLVSSSRYEGFPNVVLEALSLGVPVVATDCPGGTRELVKEGVTGWLCTHESASALAEAIERAFQSTRPTASSLRQFVDDQYSTRHVVSAYAAVLRRAAGLR